MTMPIDWEGIALPVSHTLLDILSQEVAHAGGDVDLLHCAHFPLS